MKTRIALLIFAFAALVAAQTPPVVLVPTTSTVNTSALPSIVAGIGPTWARGATNPFAVDFNFGLRVGSSNWYSYSTVSTPITTGSPAGSPPVASTITTGGAWAAAQSASGKVTLLLIVQAGFTTVQANSTVAPSFNGSVGVAFKIKPNLYVMPFAKASNATTVTNSSALATAVFQPGVQVMYGFGGK